MDAAHRARKEGFTACLWKVSAAQTGVDGITIVINLQIGRSNEFDVVSDLNFLALKMCSIISNSV